MIIINRDQILERWDELPGIFKEAIYSQQLNDQIYKISEQFHLSESKRQDVSYLCLLVFSGFVHRQDLYKELQSTLDIDNRLSLEIYGELDKKIFLPFHKDIDRNYIKFSIGADKDIEVDDSPVGMDDQVVLRGNDSDFINLSEKSNNKKSIDKVFSLDNLKQNNNNNKINLTIKPNNDIPSKGPLILRKKEEIRTVEQELPSGKYKVASFGGFGGSFNTPFSKKVGEDVSEAKVEIPSLSNSEDASYKSSVAVPVSSNNNTANKPKSIHYSSLKTDISNNENLAKNNSETGGNGASDADEVIDLSTMDFKK